MEASLRKRNGRRAFMILGVVATLAVALYFLWGWWHRDVVSTDDAQVDADVVQVSTRVAGTVLAVDVEDNHPVKKGDPLVEIDPRDLEVRVRQAEADLEAARAEADSAEAQVAVVKASSSGGHEAAQAQLTGSSAGARSAAAQVEAAQAALARARANLVKTTSDLERAKQLVAQGAVPPRELEQAQAAYDAARADVDAGEAGLDAAREGKRLADTRVAEAAGHVEQSTPVSDQIAAQTARARLARARASAAEAALDQAQLQLSYARIVSPIDGTASRLAVHAGQAVQMGQPVVAVVPARAYVIANFKETELRRIHPGEAADIEIDAYPGHPVRGRVESLSGGTGARFSLLPADNATGNFVKVVQRVPVKIALEGDLPGVLRAGLSAEVTVHLD